MPDDELDNIIEELKNDDSLSSLSETPSAERLDINDENVNDYIMQKVGRLIESGIETVEAIQQTIATGLEADELNAFSGLLTSVTNAAEALNKINIQNKKAKATKEIKEMEIEGKKMLGSGGGNTGNTNILVATREEVIERFLNKNKNYLEAEFTESKDPKESPKEDTDEQRT
jgi:hypothetical protein